MQAKWHARGEDQNAAMGSPRPICNGSVFSCGPDRPSCGSRHARHRPSPCSSPARIPVLSPGPRPRDVHGTVCFTAGLNAAGMLHSDWVHDRTVPRDSPNDCPRPPSSTCVLHHAGAQDRAPRRARGDPFSDPTRADHSMSLVTPWGLISLKPYAKRQKNDAADAEAICEAVGRPNMRFVETKTAQQQGCLTAHRSRHLFIRQHAHRRACQ
jgi:hypothetical protein